LPNWHLADGMKPEVDLERKGLSDYGTTTLPKSKSGWASEELFLLTGLVCIIFSTIGSTYYYWALLPAWEADESLGWTKSTTTLISWSSAVAEAAGLLVAGPLSDYIEPLQLILLETCLALTGVFVNSQIVTTAEGLVLNVFIIAFLKGILWPAVGATVFKMIPRERQDIFIFCGGLSSRFSGSFGDFFIGFLLNCGMSWRSSLLFVVGIDFALVLATLFCLQRTAVGSNFALGRDGAADGDPDASPIWTTNYGIKWRRLIFDARGWLALLTLAGSGQIYCLLSYLALLLKEHFNLNNGQAAMGASSLLFGVFLGLLSAGVISLYYGKDIGRRFQVWQGAIGVLFTSLLCLFPTKSLPLTEICLAFTGIGAGPFCYLPYCAYSSLVPKSQRAFCMGVIDCLAQAVQVIVRAYFGRLRIVQPLRAGFIMYDVTTIGVSASVIAAGLLYTLLQGEDAEDTYF